MEVANYLGLPQNIKQEGASREQLEQLFQGLSTTPDESGEITIEEFVDFFPRKSLSRAYIY